MSCDSVFTFAIPGPVGPAGANGTNGTNGVNPFTVTSASFVMPAELANVAVAVLDATWAVPGQIVIVVAGGSLGYFKVVSVASLSLTLENLKNTATVAYLANSAPGTSFAAAAQVSPAGVQGPSGAEAAACFAIANNLSEGMPAAMRTSLGLGALSVLNTVNNTNWFGASLAVVNGGTGSATAAAARTALGLAIGTNIQAQDATLQSIAALGTAADKIAYTTGVDAWAETGLTAYMRGLLTSVDAATARATLVVNTTALDMLIYRHEAASGFGGGVLSGGWIKVPIATEVVDQGNHGSIASNQITLAAGTYRYRFAVVASAAGVFQGRLFNVTNASVVTDGYGGSADSTALNNIQSVGEGRFTLAVPNVVRLEVFAAGTGTFGTAANSGGPEIFSWIELLKE